MDKVDVLHREIQTAVGALNERILKLEGQCMAHNFLIARLSDVLAATGSLDKSLFTEIVDRMAALVSEPAPDARTEIHFEAMRQTYESIKGKEAAPILSVIKGGRDDDG